MTKLQLEKYLRKLIKHAKVLYTEGQKFDGEVTLISYFSEGLNSRFAIHIYRGVRFIAETLNLPLGVNEDYSDEARYIWVEFEGCKFFGLESKE